MDLILPVLILLFIAFLSVFIFLLYQKVSQLSHQGSDRQTIELMSRWMEQMQQRMDRNADVLLVN